MSASRALLPILASLILASSAAPARAETWSTGDVEAAERYRDEERERAARYRAELESDRTRAREPRTAAEPKRGGEVALGDRLAARFAAWLREWVGAWLAELVEALEDWVALQLDDLRKVFEEPRARHELRRAGPARRESLSDWVAREQERARRLLEERDAKSAPPDPADEREWAERDVERAREWARRAAERERARSPAPWEERWRGAESWEAIERERAQRQLESAREWEVEERARLDGKHSAQ